MKKLSYLLLLCIVQTMGFAQTSTSLTNAADLPANVTDYNITVHTPDNLYKVNLAFFNKALMDSIRTAISQKQAALGFIPVPNTRSITINGVTQTLDNNAVFTIATDVGSVPWGALTGSISSQADLQTALANKQNLLGFNPVPVTRTINGLDLGTNRVLNKSHFSDLNNVDNTSDATKWTAAATLTNKTINGSNNTLINIPQSAITSLTTDMGNKQPLNTSLSQIAAMVSVDDDILQRKGGVWASRTMEQLKADLAIATTDITGYAADQTTITNQLNGKQNIEAGKGLSANDLTNTLLASINAIITLQNNNDFIKFGNMTVDKLDADQIKDEDKTILDVTTLGGGASITRYHIMQDFDQITTPYPLNAISVNGGTSGAAASSPADPDRPGIYRMTTGNTLNSGSGWYNASTAYRFGSTAGDWEYTHDFKIVTALSQNTDKYCVVIGFGDVITSTNQVDGVFFLYDNVGLTTGAASGGSANWQVGTVSQTTNRTFTTTNVPVIIGSFIRFKIVVVSGGTSVRFYINNVLVATHTTTIPTSGFLGLQTFGLKNPDVPTGTNNGTASLQFESDFVELIKPLNR